MDSVGPSKSMNPSSEAVTRRHGVAVACRRPDGRWLLVRRSGTVPRAPGKVCFPGGEIQPGETQPQAVVREIREELAIHVHPIRCAWRYDWPGRPWTLWGWLAEMLTTNLQPTADEIAEVLWLTDQEARDHPDAMPTNRLFLSEISNPKSPLNLQPPDPF